MKFKFRGFTQHRFCMSFGATDAGVKQFIGRYFYQIKKGAGFTLIELLVVISVISILSSITIVSMSKARAKARDAVRLSEINTILTALQAYYQNHNGWPLGDTGSYSAPVGFPATGKCSKPLNYYVCRSYEPCQSQKTDGTPNDSNWIDALGPYFASGHPPMGPTFSGDKCPHPGAPAATQSNYFYTYVRYNEESSRFGEMDLFYILENDNSLNNLRGEYFAICPLQELSSSYCMRITGQADGKIID